MKLAIHLLLSAAFVAEQVASYAFVVRPTLSLPSATVPSQGVGGRRSRRGRRNASLQMVDQNLIEGAGIAVAGLAVGIGLVAFTEAQGERAKARGSGLSESMTTRIAGALLEDVEVSSVSDISSLTSQLEKALKESGGASEEELVMSEEDKKRISNDADDGW